MPSRTLKTRGLVLALGAAVLAGYLLHAWFFRDYVNDDAYITFRYSRNFALGGGPYFNAGEHVEGYTNFLLMALLAGVIKVAGPASVTLAAKLVGVVSGLAALLASWTLCRRWLRTFPVLADHADLLAWTAPAFVALNAAYALNTASGLETTLFSAGVIAGLCVLQKSQDEARWCGAGVVLALAALTRPEGVLFAAVILLGYGLVGARRPGPRRRVLLVDGAIVVAVLIAHVAFRYAVYDGELLPNTYYAKVGDEPWSPQAAAYLRGFAGYHLGGFACAVALLPLVARQAAIRRTCLPALATCVLVIATVFKTGPDWMLGYRLLVPYTPLWAALGVVGLAALADRIGRRSVLVTVAGCAALLLVVSRQIDIRRQYHTAVEASAHGYWVGHAALGQWLHEHTRPGDAVALMDIGIVGYMNPDLRILDVSGLTDRHIAKSRGGLFHKRYDPAYVLDQHPRYIVLVLTEYEKLDGTVGYLALTPAEARLYKHPDFDAHYRRPAPARPPADRLDRLAAAFGAVRVFQHADPKAVYLLAVYAYEP